jgi:colanic acid biosynthesis glycosyl transferase WcaI
MKVKSTNNRKILFISHCCIPERIGGATHNYEMAEKLSKRGYTVDFVTTQPSYPFGDFKNHKENPIQHVNDNFKIIRIFTFRPKQSNPHFFQRILWFSLFTFNASVLTFYFMLFRNYDFVITSIPNEPSLFPGLLAKKMFRVKWIIDIRDLWFENAIELGLLEKESFLARFFKTFRSYSFRQSDGLTYTAETIVKKLEQKGYYLPEKKLFNPNGFNPDSYPLSEKRSKSVLYLGNVGLAYELDLIVDAISLSEHDDWNFVIRGGGDSLDDLKQKINEHNLADRIKLIPPLSRKELLDFVSKCYIGVCPLKNKSSLASVIPTKVIEYLGCGIPFISSGSGEVEQIALQSNAGIHIDSSPESYAESIDMLLDDRKKYNDLSKNALIYMNKSFNKEKIIDNLDKFLKEL